MEYTYSVVLERLFRTEVGFYGSYGLTATQKEANGIPRSISDITANQKLLEAFARVCNRTKLSIRHMDEVVEDFLSR
jgi:hypothetical protein